jgi:hypothetical protein
MGTLANDEATSSAGSPIPKETWEAMNDFVAHSSHPMHEYRRDILQLQMDVDRLRMDFQSRSDAERREAESILEQAKYKLESVRLRERALDRRAEWLFMVRAEVKEQMAAVTAARIGVFVLLTRGY